MTAWSELLANSALSSGTAWELLTNPATGGTGTVINDGVAVEVTIGDIETTLADEPIIVEICE